MKIFLDSANIEEIKEINDLGIIDGITTNPTLIANEGKDIRGTISKISEIVDGDISVEVVSNQLSKMLEDADKILSYGKNIVIKLPMTWEGIKACKYLTNKDHKTNMTLCFSVNQAIIGAKVGATYISPFVGRLDDIGDDGVKLIQDIKHIYNIYQCKTQILAASIRSLNHFYRIACLGADVITMPYKIIKQLINHPLTNAGIEIFEQDWKKSNLNL